MHPLSCPVKRLVLKKENASVLLKSMSFLSIYRDYEVILILEIIMLTITLSFFSRPLLHSQPNQVSEKADISELQRKPFQRVPKKLILCCSGLTVEEKVWTYMYTYSFYLMKTSRLGNLNFMDRLDCRLLLQNLWNCLELRSQKNGSQVLHMSLHQSMRTEPAKGPSNS